MHIRAYAQRTCRAAASWRRVTRIWRWSIRIVGMAERRLEDREQVKASLRQTPTRWTRTRIPSVFWTETLCWRWRDRSRRCRLCLCTSPAPSTWRAAMAPCPRKHCQPVWVRHWTPLTEAAYTLLTESYSTLLLHFVFYLNSTYSQDLLTKISILIIQIIASHGHLFTI